MEALPTHAWQVLRASLSGELFTDELRRRMYATDASLYRELPLAVAYPKTEDDIAQLIHFAQKHAIGLIPRTAGTSLAGQCVGNGIVLDTSHYFNKILSLDKEKGVVRVQPGVIRDELNRYLKPHHLFFGPNTSTANRAMIGGMVGNNSSGSYSIVYGVTRDHVIEIKGFLSDGSPVHFKALSLEEFAEKLEGDSLESQIYDHLYRTLSQPEIQAEIHQHFPKKNIHRRNTGYAVDALLDMQPFKENGLPFNASKLICGSEGTLMVMTEITLQLSPPPPPLEIMVAVHFHSLEEALRSVTLTMQHAPRAVELMDKTILDCTKANIEQSKNRFFIEGDPAAILMIELGGQTQEEVTAKADALINDFRHAQKGYHYPILFPPQSHRALELRKAGLGVLSNIKGDAKPLEFVEDTAVAVEDLADYILDFDAIMQKKYQQSPVYYAHAGAGELHIRPRVNLRTPEGVKEFRDIAVDSALLVKKYGGSLSGEHGDGRVRAEFIPLMLGEKNYALLQEIKATWDRQNIFNPGKIIDAPPIEQHLKDALAVRKSIPTVMDFGEYEGILAAAEKCSGSADCRKLHTAGGTMCPSYMATRDEKDSTRARANVLREFLIHSEQENPFAHQEIYDVMDLCLSCKGCKSECPSNVDMAALKAEFLHHYYKAKGIPLRTRAIANISVLNRWGMILPKVTNFLLENTFTSSLLKKLLGISSERSLPTLSKTSLTNLFSKNKQSLSVQNPKKKIFFFSDEFTDLNEAELGWKALELLATLGYETEIPEHVESGRAYLSKGLLEKSQILANRNFELLQAKISADTPLIGIEPSAILTFRDEFPKLVKPAYRERAKALSQYIFTVEEFLYHEMLAGNITRDSFVPQSESILLHGHCHQKVLSEVVFTKEILALAYPSVQIIPSGCCGMAGSFGYEKEHYEVSMKIGALVLFPAITQTAPATLIAASGTSCRHQIKDGTQRNALHPVEILWTALK